MRSAVGVLRRPRRGWSDARQLLQAMFEDGGAIIATSDPALPRQDPHDAVRPRAPGVLMGTDDPGIWARTVVQPDGDLLVQIRTGHEHDVALHRRHHDDLLAWLERSRRSLTGVRVVADVASWTGGLAVGVVAVARASAVGGVLALVAIPVVTAAGGMALGLAWRGLLRRGLRHVFSRAA